MFFMTALYLQQVHGDSALDGGRALRADGDRGDRLRGVGAQLVTRLGTRAAYIGGSAVGVVGLLLLSQAGAGSGYALDILPGLVVFGLGLPLVGVANQIAAVAEVPHEDAGAASGIVTTAFQVGGAIGLALVSTAATTRVGDAVAAGASQPEALASGFERGMLVAAGLAAAQPASSARCARRASSRTPRSWRRRPRGSVERVTRSRKPPRHPRPGCRGAPLPAHPLRHRPRISRTWSTGTGSWRGTSSSRSRRRSSRTRASTWSSSRTRT